jgi:hypothetical protein
MDKDFTDIIQLMTKEQGKEILVNGKAKIYMSDYCKGQFKKEVNVFCQILDANCGELINNADNVTERKLKLMARLEDDTGLAQKVTAEYLDLLGLILKGDTSKSGEQVQAVTSETSAPVKETPVHVSPAETSASRQTTSATSSSAINYKKISTEYTHKKQTGGHGEYAKVVIEFERCKEKGLQIINKIFGGAIPKNYIPGIEKGLLEALQNCILVGYPDVGLKATLIDGKYHPIDSSELSFKMAAIEAFNSYLKQIS